MNTLNIRSASVARGRQKGFSFIGRSTGGQSEQGVGKWDHRGTESIADQRMFYCETRWGGAKGKGLQQGENLNQIWLKSLLLQLINGDQQSS